MQSQVDEFAAVSYHDIGLAMETLKDQPTTLMFHAERIPSVHDPVTDVAPSSTSPRQPDDALDSYSTFLASRPPVLETCAVSEILSLAHLAPDLALHIVHLSAVECIPLLRAARARGVRITAETCFHYLGLTAETVPDGDTRHKCCPPIRGAANRDALWLELVAGDGVLATVVSDHSPCTPALKLLPTGLHDGTPLAEHGSAGVLATTATTATTATKTRGDFFAAWGGISSLGLGLSILYTAARARQDLGLKVPSLLDMVRLCCQATAVQVGLAHRKGGLKAGMDADVCVFDDTEEWTLATGDMRWKNKCSPWEGHEFKGRVRETWLRGQLVFQLGGKNVGYVGGRPTGEAIVERRIE